MYHISIVFWTPSRQLVFLHSTPSTYYCNLLLFQHKTIATESNQANMDNTKSLDELKRELEEMKAVVSLIFDSTKIRVTQYGSENISNINSVLYIIEYGSISTFTIWSRMTIVILATP